MTISGTNPHAFLAKLQQTRPQAHRLGQNAKTKPTNLYLNRIHI